MNRIILSILLGSLSGVFGGALGLGGSSVILPGLLILGIIKDYKTAVGTTLFTLLPPFTLFAVIEYYKRNQVDVKIGAITCLAYMIFSYVGAKINHYLTTKTLEYTTSGFFLLSSIYFFRKAYNTF